MGHAKNASTLCSTCGNVFQIESYLLKIPTKTGRFCSASCRSQAMVKVNPACQKRRITVSCAECDGSIDLWPSKVLKENFCTFACHRRFRNRIRWQNPEERLVVVLCTFCSHENNVAPWKLRAGRNQSQFFCDRACFSLWKSANWIGESNPAWKGGWTRHGTGWNAIRAVVRSEQGYKCADCPATEDSLGKELDVHHIIPARLFEHKADGCVRSNLTGLCHPCHMRREYAIAA